MRSKKIKFIGGLLFISLIIGVILFNYKQNINHASLALTPQSGTQNLAGEWFNHLDILDKNDPCSKKVLNQIEYLNNEKLYNQFTFDKYKIDTQLTKEPADLNINSNKTASLFRGSIQSELTKNGINFAGHYTIVSVGMTGWGEGYWIIDRINGQAYNFPYLATFIDFNKNSNLIVMNAKEAILNKIKKGYDDFHYLCDAVELGGIYYNEIRPFYFLWQNNQLILLGQEDIKPPINTFWEDYFN
jgi:hypothetical protein